LACGATPPWPNLKFCFVKEEALLQGEGGAFFRSYLLYDKICRDDILRHAYGLARANAGAQGVDGLRLVAAPASEPHSTWRSIAATTTPVEAEHWHTQPAPWQPPEPGNAVVSKRNQGFA
jgi:hypothetical protein